MAKPKEPERLLDLPGTPTLDSLIARLPTRLSDQELDSIIAHDRAARAEWLTKEEKREAKKRSKEEAQEEDDE